MGISRDSRHKRRKTGGRMPIHKKKRAFEKARQPAMTKLGPKRIHPVRGRGGNLKYRALRLDAGNFSWASQNVTIKSRILWVVYNATNNELVRTNTITKNTILEVDATPFKAFFYKTYGQDLGKVKKEETATRSAKAQEKWEKIYLFIVNIRKYGENMGERRNRIQKEWEENAKEKRIDPTLESDFKTGRLLACITSRPGQSGRADGYILEGEELEFYKKKLEKKKTK